MSSADIIKMLEEANDSLSLENTSLAEQLEEEQRKSGKLASDKEKLVIERDQILVELNSLRTLHKRANINRENAEKSKRITENKYRKAAQELETIRIESDGMLAEVRKDKAEIANLKKETAKLIKETQEQDDEIEELNDQIDELEQNLLQLEDIYIAKSSQLTKVLSKEIEERVVKESEQQWIEVYDTLNERFEEDLEEEKKEERLKLFDFLVKLRKKQAEEAKKKKLLEVEKVRNRASSTGLKLVKLEEEDDNDDKHEKPKKHKRNITLSQIPELQF